MPDIVDAVTRSRIMRRVRSKNTGLEMRLRRALWQRGVRGYRCHMRSIAGVPDIAWPGLRLAVFVDSAWWHGHPSRYVEGRLPPTWDRKIASNRVRDETVNQLLATEGWSVVRVWDFELANDLDATAGRIAAALSEARRRRH